MFKASLATGVAIVISALGSNVQSPSTLPADVVAANHALDQQLVDAHVKKDTSAVLALFSSRNDVFFIAPNGTVNKGRDQIRDSYDRFFAGLESISGDIKEVSYLRQGDGIIAVGTIVFHPKPNGRQQEDRTVVWTDFRQKENGRWVFVFRHAHWPVQAPRP